MPKLKKKVAANFTVIHNQMIRDYNLGATERGVLLTMLSLPEDWNFSIKGLSKILPDGVTKISTALKNLEKYKYLIRKRIYCNGKISDWEYIFSDEPMEEQDEDNQDTENLDSENLNQGMQDVEKPSNNKIYNNQINKNKINIDKISINQSFEETSKEEMIDGLNSKNQKREIVDNLIRSNLEYEWYEDLFENCSEKDLQCGNPTFAQSLEEVDMIIGIIVSCICSDDKYVRIGGQDIPHSVVEAQFMKLKQEHLEYVLKRLMLSTTKITNPTAYLLTTIYNSVLSCQFMENTDLKAIDPALFIPEEFHTESFKDRFYGHTSFRPKKAE